LSGSGHSRLLKILHIDPERHWGGGEAQVFGLLSYLAEKGHRNVVLADPRGRLFETTDHLNIEIRRFTIRNELDLKAAWRLRRLIQNEDYDIVHFHTKRAHALSLWLSRIHRRPKYVVTRRMDYPIAKGWYTDQLYNRSVDGVIAISQPIVELLADAGIDRNKIRLIHSGVDLKRFELANRARDPNSDVPVIGMTAVMEERKGHRYLLEAAALLKKQGRRIRYLLAGEGSLKAELERSVGSLGLNEEVSFAGFVSDVPTFLRAIDIFVMPSLFEGLGVAALEAMAAGKPVVASKVGGLAETVNDSITGFLIPPRDPGALAAALKKLIANKSMAQEMGVQARRRIEEHFTLEKTAARNEAYYYELVGGVRSEQPL
jgi:glycosyltransferase involved in cell wall biosynthesis